MARKPRTRRKERKSIPVGRAYIQSTFNNTMITITDPQGNPIAWGSAGTVGFKGSRKSTAFAAQRAGEDAARKGKDHGIRQVEVFVRGPGPGREAAIRGVSEASLLLHTPADPADLPDLPDPAETI